MFVHLITDFPLANSKTVILLKLKKSINFNCASPPVLRRFYCVLGFPRQSPITSQRNLIELVFEEATSSQYLLRSLHCCFKVNICKQPLVLAARSLALSVPRALSLFYGHYVTMLNAAGVFWKTRASVCLLATGVCASVWYVRLPNDVTFHCLS